jgi:hypothetical protein
MLFYYQVTAPKLVARGAVKEANNNKPRLFWFTSKVIML